MYLRKKVSSHKLNFCYFCHTFSARTPVNYAIKYKHMNNRNTLLLSVMRVTVEFKNEEKMNTYLLDFLRKKIIII